MLMTYLNDYVWHKDTVLIIIQKSETKPKPTNTPDEDLDWYFNFISFNFIF